MLHLKLGAPLYMPATRTDLAAIGNGRQIPQARTIIFCTEDAILEEELPQAIQQLRLSLPMLEGKQEDSDGADAMPFRYIRPRSPKVLEQLLALDGIRSIHGFVLPKVTSANLPQWIKALEPHPEYRVMLSVETADVFEPDRMRRLRDEILSSCLRDRIICMRVGALDLLNLLGLRRSCSKSIYKTPVGQCIQCLITIFVPAGLPLSAPAFECLHDHSLLREELELDVLNGLFCKTALHPAQLPVIHAAYRVAPEELEMAQALFDPVRPAVFSMHGRMCEKATHIDWAGSILLRADIYGTTADG